MTYHLSNQNIEHKFLLE